MKKRAKVSIRLLTWYIPEKQSRTSPEVSVFSFRYKSLSLNTSFSLLLGSKKRLPSPYSDFQGSGSMMPDPTKNVNRDLLNRWQKPGDQTDIPRFVYGEPATSTNSSRYIHSTDHYA